MAKQLPPQVQAALLWVKGNVITVVFCAIVIVVPVGAYFGADAFRSGIEAEAKKRAAVFSELKSTADARVSLPLPGGEDFPLPGLPTEATVTEYETILTKVSADAQAVYGKGLAFNKGGVGVAEDRAILAPTSFPGYRRSNRTEREAIRLQFGDAIRKRYEDLLESCRAGRPPESSAVEDAVRAAEKRFVQGQLKQESRAKLDAEQLAALDRHLGRARIEQYFETAKKISFYVDRGAFQIPTREFTSGLLKGPSDSPAALDEQDTSLFALQWRYWVISDVLRGFAAANGSTPAVLKAPVKRVIRIEPNVPDLTQKSGAGEAASFGGEAPAAGMPAEGAMADGAAAPAAGAGAGAVPDVKLGAPMVDPKMDAARDFSKGFTGRVSNAVYDVVTAEVVFVAETAQLTKVFDALAKQNFMTVTNVRVAPADPFIDARDGYLYGAEPVSLVTATVETLWLREWTAPFMPAVVRTALGIQSASPEGAPVDGSGQMGME
jgi:hypothetical protein